MIIILIIYNKLSGNGTRVPGIRFRKIVEAKCKEEIKYGNVDSEKPTKWMKWSGQSRKTTCDSKLIRYSNES